MPESGRPERLTEEQRARADIARRDRDRARAADLVAMTPPDLIVMIEQLRGSLDDAVRLIDELIEP